MFDMTGEAFKSTSYLWQNVVSPVLEKPTLMVRGPAIEVVFCLRVQVR